jgi:hypothetical protein
MGVDLGGGDICVPQQKLNHTQVSAMVEQVGCERVTQGVG